MAIRGKSSSLEESTRNGPPAAVLVSGGIDSAVLTAELCDSHTAVFPLFIRGGLLWEHAELEHLQRFLDRVARPELQPLQLLDQPVRDVYGDHWSVTGLDVPDAQSPDGAVFLPGRNLFLVAKAAVWCVLHQVEILALGSLHSNPFPDSTPEFDRRLEQLVRQALSSPFCIVRPFAKMSKSDVVHRGANLPLEWTFSCIRPVGGMHCGTCNKCAERRSGFAQARVSDPTLYADREPKIEGRGPKTADRRPRAEDRSSST